MFHTANYVSPLGEILLAADEIGLTGLWFKGQKYFARGLGEAREESSLPVLDRAKQWLDLYFAGKAPDFSIPLHLLGTPFQQQVWELLLAIPYGQTRTYGQLAGQLAEKRGLEHMAARAVGSAVGRNPVSIIVPCHRVVGSAGKLTGYAGGVQRKAALLRLEHAQRAGTRGPSSVETESAPPDHSPFTAQWEN